MGNRITALAAVAALLGVIAFAGFISFEGAASAIADDSGAYNLIELNAALASAILGCALVMTFLVAAHVVRHWNRS